MTWLPFCLDAIPFPPLKLTVVLVVTIILPLSVPSVSCLIALPSTDNVLFVDVSVIPVPGTIFLNCKSHYQSILNNY